MEIPVRKAQRAAIPGILLQKYEYCEVYRMLDEVEAEK